MLLGSTLIALGAVERASQDHARSKRHFLHALETAMETKTITVVLQALAEIAVSAMNEGENELALELVIYALQHPLVNARLKARLDQAHAGLVAQLTPKQVAEIEERVCARTLESLLQDLLLER